MLPIVLYSGGVLAIAAAGLSQRAEVTAAGAIHPGFHAAEKHIEQRWRSCAAMQLKPLHQRKGWEDGSLRPLQWPSTRCGNQKHGDFSLPGGFRLATGDCIYHPGRRLRQIFAETDRRMESRPGDPKDHQRADNFMQERNR